MGAVSHDLLRRGGDYSPLFPLFFALNSHLERQCVFVKLIVIHLFTPLVNKWDHYSVCGGGGGGVGWGAKKKSELPGASTKSSVFAEKLFVLHIFVVVVVALQ